MNMEIEILEPILRCITEEEVFYQRLSEVVGIMKITRATGKIHLTVAGEFKEQAVQQVVAICEMWHTSYKMAAD